MKKFAVYSLSSLIFFGCGADQNTLPTQIAPPPQTQLRFATGGVDTPPEVHARIPDQLPPDLVDNVPGRLTPPDRAMVPFVPPVADQGHVGSCAAHAHGYLQGSQTFARVTGIDPASPENQASRAWLYRKILQRMGIHDQLTGTSSTQYMRQLVEAGSPSEAAVPYPLDPAVLQNPEALTSYLLGLNLEAPQQLSFQAGSYARLSGSEQELLHEMKLHLANGAAIGYGTLLPTDFGAYRSGVYVSQQPLDPDSGHAMAVIGYDDTLEYTDHHGHRHRGAFRIQNSWNPQHWGEAGRAWVAYETFFRSAAPWHYDFYVLNPPLTEPRTSNGGLLESPGLPSGEVLDVRQAQDGDTVALVLKIHLPFAVEPQTLELVQPGGVTALQVLGHFSFRSGVLHFTRKDGNQFLAGPQTVRLGSQFGIYEGQINVPPLADSALPAAALDGKDENGTTGQPVTTR